MFPPTEPPRLKNFFGITNSPPSSSVKTPPAACDGPLTKPPFSMVLVGLPVKLATAAEKAFTAFENSEAAITSWF